VRGATEYDCVDSRMAFHILGDSASTHLSHCPFDNKSPEAVGYKYDGVLILKAPLKLDHHVLPMLHNAILVGGREEGDDVCVVAIRPNSRLWRFCRESRGWPEVPRNVLVARWAATRRGRRLY
jgi:hypothetical protein